MLSGGFPGCRVPGGGVRPPVPQGGPHERPLREDIPEALGGRLHLPALQREDASSSFEASRKPQARDNKLLSGEVRNEEGGCRKADSILDGGGPPFEPEGGHIKEANPVQAEHGQGRELLIFPLRFFIISLAMRTP